MALNKEIILNNGITTNYHRIVSLNKITNQINLIEVGSYINKLQRDKEVRYQALQKKNNEEGLTNEERIELDKGISVFIDTDYINIPYDEDMTIESAYDYLKTLDKFKDATDI